VEGQGPGLTGMVESIGDFERDAQQADIDAKSNPGTE
jgi:hypothetical protein